MNYIQDLYPYLTLDGTITFPRLGERSDNPFIGNATDLFIRRKLFLSLADAEDRSLRYFQKRRALSHTWLPSTEPGAWSTPGQSHDDINALLCHGEDYAHYLYKGCGPFWIFNSEGTIAGAIRGIYYRMGYLVPVIRAVTKRKVPKIEQAWYAWDIKKAMEAPTGETSTRCLYVLQSQYIHLMPPKMRLAMIEFLEDCTKRYGDLSGLYSIYFGVTHPFAIHTRGVKFL